MRQDRGDDDGLPPFALEALRHLEVAERALDEALSVSPRDPEMIAEGHAETLALPCVHDWLRSVFVPQQTEALRRTQFVLPEPDVLRMARWALGERAPAIVDALDAYEEHLWVGVRRLRDELTLLPEPEGSEGARPLEAGGALDAVGCADALERELKILGCWRGEPCDRNLERQFMGPEQYLEWIVLPKLRALASHDLPSLRPSLPLGADRGALDAVVLEQVVLELEPFASTRSLRSILSRMSRYNPSGSADALSATREDTLVDMASALDGRTRKIVLLAFSSTLVDELASSVASTMNQGLKLHGFGRGRAPIEVVLEKKASSILAEVTRSLLRSFGPLDPLDRLEPLCCLEPCRFHERFLVFADRRRSAVGLEPFQMPKGSELIADFSGSEEAQAR